MTQTTHVESPCTQVCTLDASGLICLGCFRSLDEIGMWSQLSNAARARVLQRLPERRGQFELANPPAKT